MTDQPTLTDPSPASRYDDLFDPDLTFADLGLGEVVLKGLTEHGFEKPTAIQAKLIPAILQGKDVIGQAKTGTGKTAAFGLPMLEDAVQKQHADAERSHADAERSEASGLSGKPMGLILAPTRELAAQIAAELDELGRHTGIRTTVVIGGESAHHQRKSLEEGGHIVVGTPGRVLDLHGRHQLDFQHIRFVALDEVDRMFDIGFRDDIRKVLKSLPKERQTIFVSATLNEEIEQLARRYMKPDAEKIVTVGGSLTVAQVEQWYLTVAPWDKRALLLKLLVTEKPETTVVFCKTKMTVRKVAEYLKQKGLNVREIHGDMRQSKRNSVMTALRGEKVDVLIASDLAARGLDVDHITHVINYDLPEDPEIYIHRIGRTARAGRRGVAWSFVTPEQGQQLTQIEILAGAMIEPMEYPDFVPGPVPKDVEDRMRSVPQRPTQPAKAIDRAVGMVKADELTDEQKAAMFPGGIVPKGPPKKNLGSAFKRRGR